MICKSKTCFVLLRLRVHSCHCAASLCPGRTGTIRLHCSSRLALSLLFVTCCVAEPHACRPIYAQTAPTSASGANASASAPQLKADLQRILRSEEFQPEGKSKNSLTRLVQTLRERWEQLRKWFAGLFHGGGLRGGGTALTWTLVTLMACALLWVAYRLLRDWTPRAKPAPALNPLRGQDEAAPADIIRDPQHWRHQAEEHARAGDYRAAYRALFLAVLLRLDHAGVLSYDIARTNGDYLRALRTDAQATLHDLLLPPAQDFDRFWYGRAEASMEDYQTLIGIYKRLPASFANLPAARINNPLPDSSNLAPPTHAQAKGEQTL